MHNRWHDPAVRDLYWAINSPSLIHTAELTQWHDSDPFFLDLLNRLDQHPHTLTDWLAQKLPTTKTPRLGYYFECLWHFYLEQHPDYQVLAKNLQIRTPEKITLGELDLIVRDLKRDCVMHIELAVKFYLAVPDVFEPHDLAAYIGPGLKDRLVRKYFHTLNHQLPLSSSNAAKAVDINVDETHAIFRGRLFQPLASAFPHQPAWLTRQQLWQLSKIDEIILLNRSDWFAEHQRMPKEISSAELIQPDVERIERPVQMAVINKRSGMETRRLFLVPDDWEHAARERFSDSIERS